MPELHRPIIQRAIHATGDTEYAYNLLFHPKAVEAGIRSIKRRENIVTDVSMVGSPALASRPVENWGKYL